MGEVHRVWEIDLGFQVRCSPTPAAPARQARYMRCNRRTGCAAACSPPPPFRSRQIQAGNPRMPPNAPPDLQLAVLGQLRDAVEVPVLRVVGVHRDYLVVLLALVDHLEHANGLGAQEGHGHHRLLCARATTRVVGMEGQSEKGMRIRKVVILDVCPPCPPCKWSPRRFKPQGSGGAALAKGARPQQYGAQ